MHVNLLPRSFLVQLLVWKRIRQWGCIAVACQAVVLAITMNKGVTVVAEQRKLAAIDERCGPLYAVEEQKQQLEEQLAQSASQQSSLAQLETDRRVLGILAIISEASRQTHEGQQIQRLQLSDLAPVVTAQVAPTTRQEPRPPANAPNSPATPVVARGRLIIQGIAADDLTVSRLVEGLRKAGAFELIELKSATELSTPSQRGRQFEILCRFE